VQNSKRGVPSGSSLVSLANVGADGERAERLQLSTEYGRDGTDTAMDAELVV